MTQLEATSAGDAQPGWQARPALARVARAAQILLPFIAGWFAIRLLQPYFVVVSESRAIFAMGWIIQAIAITVLVSGVVAKLMHRFTPLVALLNMSLVFPDSTPSRFGIALRSGGLNKLLENEDLKLSGSLQESAEQAVELVGRLSRHEPLTRGHTERVRAYTEVIGRQLGLDEDAINGLRWGALLHDIGKLRVPARILNKAGTPNEVEWEILRGHPAAGAAMLAPLEDWLGDWLLAAGQHHEKWDGSGYPAGLSGHEISLAGRIVAVADAYDVITSRRSYKQPMTAEFARKEMVRSSGTQFDPTIVRALIEAGLTTKSRAGSFGWLLELPGLAKLLLATAGQTATTATVAVAVSAAAVGPGGPGLIGPDAVGVPSAAAFVESIDIEEPTLPLASTTTTLVVQDGLVSSSTTSTTALATTSTVVDGESDSASSTTTQLAPATTEPAPTQPVPVPQRPDVTTTTRPAQQTTTTTAVESQGCTAIRSGETFMPGADLRNCDLAGLTFDGLHLVGARLEGADLTGVRFTNFNFNDAVFDGATLTNATFVSGSADRASFDRVVADGARFDNVNMWKVTATRIDFTDARIDDVSFGEADLRGADFRGARIKASNFNRADMTNADVTGVNLSHLDFDNAVIERLNLSDSILTWTNFTLAIGTPLGTETAIFTTTICPDGSTTVRTTDTCW